uniref:Uncharacterized protein n=1 Tax=Opuntia streptacantha TaxID=393608 RepID=A0A7C9EMW6_OPUST
MVKIKTQRGSKQANVKRRIVERNPIPRCPTEIARLEATSPCCCFFTISTSNPIPPYLLMTCQEVNGLPRSRQNGKAVGGSVSASGLNSELHDYMNSFSPKLDFDDGDIDDELDPLMKEELDREVEDFARRLNSDWPERMQEILSLGQGRRLTSISLTTNGSAQ